MKDAKLLLETLIRFWAISLFALSTYCSFKDRHAEAASNGAAACFFYIMTLKKSEEP